MQYVDSLFYPIDPYVYPSASTILFGLKVYQIVGVFYYDYFQNYLAHSSSYGFLLKFQNQLVNFYKAYCWNFYFAGLKLNLQISLRRINILTILRFSIHTIYLPIYLVSFCLFHQCSLVFVVQILHKFFQVYDIVFHSLCAILNGIMF